MIKYLTAIFFFAGLFIGVFFIVKHEKKRKQDKTVLVDTTRAAALVDSLYVTGGGVLISNDSTITISHDPFDDRLNRLEKKAAQLQKEINRIKRKLDVYFAPDTFSIEAAQPGDFILLADTIITWKDGILNDRIPWKAVSITDTILWKAN